MARQFSNIIHLHVVVVVVTTITTTTTATTMMMMMIMMITTGTTTRTTTTTTTTTTTMMIMMMIIMMIIIILIAALRGAIIEMLTISSLRRELSPTRTLKWPWHNCVQLPCNTSGAYRVHNMSCKTWYEGTAQLLSLTELKWHLCELALCYWPKPLTDEGIPCVANMNQKQIIMDEMQQTMAN